MLKYIYILTFTFLYVVCIFATEVSTNKSETTYGKVIGTVLDSDGEPLMGVNVFISGTTIGTPSDIEGKFDITNVPVGSYEIVASMVGYKSDKIEVAVSQNKSTEVLFKLKESFYETGSVVVTGTATPYLYEESPVKTEVIPRKLIEQTRSVNLAEALGLQTGLRVENDCQNCNFTQVRILGFEGKYSQILVDGDPVVSSLAGVYALEQFPESMIGQIEVVKGGGSSLYGSGAIAGTINLITQQPQLNRTEIDYNAISLEGIMDHNVNATAELVSDDGKNGAYIFGSIRNRNPYDRNGDGFSELGSISNQSIGFNYFYKPTLNSDLKVSLHRIQETRRGGNDFNLPHHEADISEAVEHLRWGGKVKWVHNLSTSFDYQVFTSVGLLERDSYYGGLGDEDGDGVITDVDRAAALAYYGRSENKTYLTGARANYAIGINKFTAGVEFHSDEIIDNSVKDSRYHIDETYTNLGFYVQDAISLMDDDLKLVLGARLDKHSELSDPILSPRINFKYEIMEGLDLRGSFASGFKAPQTFDEDLHIESLGGDQRVVRNSDDLKEEKSYSISGGFEFERFIGDIPILLGVTGFSTTLDDAFVEVEANNPNIDLIIWDRINSDGATLTGVEIDFGIKPVNELEIRGGFTIKQNEYDSEQEIFDGVFSKKFQRTPDVFGTARVTYQAHENLSFIGALRYTGTMEVPNEVTEEIIETDDTFLELDLGLAYKVPALKYIGGQISIGVKNITDAYQKDLGIGVDRDPAYLYGPQLPRRIYFGFSTSF